MRRAAFSLLPLLFLAACSPRAIHVPASTPTASNRLPYVDLEPGWRIRVITPITRSGKYTVAESSQQQSGNTLTLSTNGDFLGYETDFYSVNPHGRDGVTVHFASAAENKDGSTTPLPTPRLALFQLPRDAKYVRLLYLRRESQTDHDMAVLSSSQRELLAALTERVQSDPQACQNEPHSYCAWIPAGIAVRPERPQNVNGSETWLPAR